MSKKLPELRRTQRPGTSSRTTGRTAARPANTAPGAEKSAAKAGAKKPAAAKKSAAAASSGVATRSARPSSRTTDKRPEKAAASSSTTSQTTSAGVAMTAETEAVASEPVVVNHTLRRAQANAIVSKYAAWSSAFGVLPIPFADIAGISGTQVAMVVALCKHYDVPFSEKWVRAILSAIAGGVAPWAVTSGVVSTFLKGVPGWGLGVGFVGMAGLSNLASRTIGKLFIEHFESGGTLEDVDTAAMKASLSEEMKKKN
jgi:uncharacterized protein (DUF697 family)